jgi:S1-C subfamily serine protease
VTWVDAEGPAAGQLLPTDVIETVAGETLVAMDDWAARLARVTPGDSIVLGVRRKGEVHEVHLTAAHRPALPAEPSRLGLTMRAIPGTGAEVVRVDSGSAAARAGIQAGDVLTLIGQTDRPTPAAVNRAFLAMPEDGALLVGFVRAQRHHVVALEKW